MVKYSAQNNNNIIINNDDRRRGGIILTQLGEDNRGEVFPGSNGITIADKKCFKYNKFGHIAWNCTLNEEYIQGKMELRCYNMVYLYFRSIILMK